MMTAPSLGSITTPLGVWVGPRDGVFVIRTLLSDQIPTCLVLRISGIELQLLCGVRIEPAHEVGMFDLFPGFP